VRAVRLAVEVHVEDRPVVQEVVPRDLALDHMWRQSAIGELALERVQRADARLGAGLVPEVCHVLGMRLA
jgi:hypothetical protein